VLVLVQLLKQLRFLVLVVILVLFQKSYSQDLYQRLRSFPELAAAYELTFSPENDTLRNLIKDIKGNSNLILHVFPKDDKGIENLALLKYLHNNTLGFNLNIYGELRGDKFLFALQRTDFCVTCFFETGSTVLSDSCIQLLKPAVYILQRTGRNMLIEGHSDNRGRKSSNEKLSFERAYAIKQYFMDSGVSEFQLEINAFGSNRPIYPHKNKELQAYNRRATARLKNER
jgi:hypothetical protein